MICPQYIIIHLRRKLAFQELQQNLELNTTPDIMAVNKKYLYSYLKEHLSSY